MFDVLLGTPLPYAGVFLLGLVIGSFLNVVIYRLPIMMEREWRTQCNELLEADTCPELKDRFDLSWPPSRCPGCEVRIRPIENIPVVSWLWLRGRCRNCGVSISVRYPLVELLTGVLFLLVLLQLGPSLQAVTGLLFVSFLVAATFIDLDHQLLPDSLTLPLLWTGLLISVDSVHISPVDSILGAVIGYLSLWSVFHVFRLLTGKEGMGHGDFKLLAALGAWLGWSALPIVILLASVVGVVVSLLAIALGRLKQGHPVPFGPFLATGGLFAFLWGADFSLFELIGR